MQGQICRAGHPLYHSALQVELNGRLIQDFEQIDMILEFKRVFLTIGLRKEGDKSQSQDRGRETASQATMVIQTRDDSIQGQEVVGHAEFWVDFDCRISRVQRQLRYLM